MMRQAAALPGSRTRGGLHDIVDEHAAAHPASLAAKDGAFQWSYAELQDASLRLAAALVTGHGVVPSEVVAAVGNDSGTSGPTAPRPLALHMPRGCVWYALCIAAWRLGLPVAALSDDMKDKVVETDRNRCMLRELRPVLLVGAALGTGLQESAHCGCPEVLASTIWSEASTISPSNCPLSRTVPTDVLTYNYTGGTTRRSKCVVITHNMALWEMQHYPAILQGGPFGTDRVLQYTSAFWGAAAFGQIDIALAIAGCAVFVPAPHATSDIAREVAANGITILGTVPSQLRGAFPGGPASCPPSLRMVLTWGEKLPVKLSQQWKQRLKIIELLIASEYWLAFHSDCSTCADPGDNTVKHVLHAVPGLDYVLLQDDGSPARAGEMGELCISGPTVTPGYVSAAEPFDGSGAQDENSFTMWQGRRYFRTSDRLRLLGSDRLLYCGRRDALAKRGGAWVDLEAIESSVALSKGIAGAAAVADEEVHLFLELEPYKWQEGNEPILQMLDRVRRTLASDWELHIRSSLPLHPTTAKTDRRKLQAAVKAMQERGLNHLERLKVVHKKMLQSYCSWYLLLLPCISWGWLISLIDGDIGNACWDLALRLLILPYLWCSVVHIPGAPEKLKRISAYPLGYADVLLVSIGLIPCKALLAAWNLSLWCCASGRVAHRKSRSGTTAGMSEWSVVVVHGVIWGYFFYACIAAIPELVLHDFVLAATLCMVACCLLATSPMMAFSIREQCKFLLSFPLTFYIFFPRWMNDDWNWRCAQNNYGAAIRWFLLQRLFRPRPPWDAGLVWEDEGADAVKDWSTQEDNLWLGTYLGGAVLGAGFWVRDWLQKLDKPPAEPRPPVDRRAADNGTCCGPSASSNASEVGETRQGGKLSDVDMGACPDGQAMCSLTRTLQSMVERVGADMLGALDSLQSISLAELIRRDLRKDISVAALLHCTDIAQLAEVVRSCKEAHPQGEDHKQQELPDRDGAFRVFALQFPRAPVDWCLRLLGDDHPDLAALQRAIARLVARHSALRTVQTPDEPIRETMDVAAGMWQLWVCFLSSRLPASCWSLVSSLTSKALLACWPRTFLKTVSEAVVPIKEPLERIDRDETWDNVDEDDHIHFAVRDVVGDYRWPYEVAVIPLLRRRENTAVLTVAEARRLPVADVAWYVYFSITHAYSDGACGQAIYDDLVRYYLQEKGDCSLLHLHHRQEEEETSPPEHLALLQMRLRASLRGRPYAFCSDSNNDVYHESICGDWGRRMGYSRRLYFRPAILEALRLAGKEVLGCGLDVAWLTAIMGTVFRLFTDQSRICLVLKVPCRDGPGERHMVGFLSEQRVLPIDIGDPSTASLVDIMWKITAARRARTWRVPLPYEPGLCVYVNIVPAMLDTMPEGFKHVPKPAATPRRFRGDAYAHLNLRLDQLSGREWDFRIFHWDAAWGWDWSRHFAGTLAGTIGDLVLAPTMPLMGPPPEWAKIKPVEPSEGCTGSQKRKAVEDGEEDEEGFNANGDAPPAKVLRPGPESSRCEAASGPTAPPTDTIMD